MTMSVRDRLRYRDISWLMPAIDVVDVLERLGVERISVHGDRVVALCPEHYAFVQRISSHPNWIVNTKTGQTYCRTEPRGSNLVWTVCRMLGCEPKDAVRFMTGKDASQVSLAANFTRIARLRKSKTEEKRELVCMDDMSEDLKSRFISDACYEFFMHPPGKKPTNICRETVDRYRVFERRWGYYSNRAVVPFFSGEELVGFCAIDLLGKERWLMEHLLKDEDDYRKTLFPSNFLASEYLFGYDDCRKGAEFIIVTEGVREVMKLWQEGFPDSVGCLKASLSDPQVELLTKIAPKEVILMFDGDPAGWAAVDKNAARLGKSVFTNRVRRAILPVGIDPKNLDSNDIRKIIKRSRERLDNHG